mmetsp:Transcript_25481/g.64669  ORF Transcript_25481/g.64669 Transcript_25481/m.64669 type:complete len:320 (-) Transcript_25481:246-1205(-)
MHIAQVQEHQDKHAQSHTGHMADGSLVGFCPGLGKLLGQLLGQLPGHVGAHKRQVSQHSLLRVTPLLVVLHGLDQDARLLQRRHVLGQHEREDGDGEVAVSQVDKVGVRVLGGLGVVLQRALQVLVLVQQLRQRVVAVGQQEGALRHRVNALAVLQVLALLVALSQGDGAPQVLDERGPVGQRPKALQQVRAQLVDHGVVALQRRAHVQARLDHAVVLLQVVVLLAVQRDHGVKQHHQVRLGQHAAVLVPVVLWRQREKVTNLLKLVLKLLLPPAPHLVNLNCLGEILQAGVRLQQRVLKHLPSLLKHGLGCFQTLPRR